MNKYIAPFLFVAVIGNTQATEITNTNATGTTFKFTATLNAPLTTGNKVKIDFGKGGLKTMTCSAKNCTLSSNVLPTGISTATYKIGIYDTKNVLQGSTSDGTYVITSTPSAPASNYTKIANDGSELPDSAKLGSNPKDWACTKDNKTGLIWEVKTSDGGLRDSTKKYTNYTSEYPNCNWTDCEKKYPGKFGDVTNTDGFINTVNKQSLCEGKNWRLPTITELTGLIYCSDDKYQTYKLSTGFTEGGYVCTSNDKMLFTKSPTLNVTYFPDITNNYSYWTSSAYFGATPYQWIVDFGLGYYGTSGEGSNYYARLVHAR